MPAQRPDRMPGFMVRRDQPLLGVPLQKDGQEVVCYFAEEAQADAAIPQHATQDALSLAGVWHDLDWDTMAKALEHIRHESPPSPPLAL